MYRQGFCHGEFKQLLLLQDINWGCIQPRILYTPINVLYLCNNIIIAYWHCGTLIFYGFIQQNLMALIW